MVTAAQLDLFSGDTDYDAAPTRLIRLCARGHPELRGHLWLHGCSHCGSTLAYDEEADDVCCMLCARRQDAGVFVTGDHLRDVTQMIAIGRSTGRAGAAWW